MLDPRYVSEHLEEVRAALTRRSSAHAASLDAVAELANERRHAVTETEGLRAKKNEASESMAKLDKKGEAFAARRDELKVLGDQIKGLEGKLAVIEAKLEDAVLYLPNLPHESVPDGHDESHNRVAKVWGEKPTLSFAPKDHHDLGVELGILDFERAAKMSGARFTVQVGAAARMTRALMQLMLDTHTGDHGYTELWPPALVLASALRGTGQLPKFAADVFKTHHTELGPDAKAEEHAANELYLVPTAEVPVTNYHADEIFDPGVLPLAYCAYTPCFRSEAGTYGKDTRGLIRQHQFDKVELVQIVAAEQSNAALEQLTRHAELILEKLDLPYRRVALCAGDMGFSAAKTYDLEVWLPAQNTYREISSCSNFEAFQARRMQARVRNEKNKTELVHTLNGSGLAVGRTLVAIMENYQNADGSITVPQVLRAYMGGAECIAVAS